MATASEKGGDHIELRTQGSDSTSAQGRRQERQAGGEDAEIGVVSSERVAPPAASHVEPIDVCGVGPLDALVFICGEAYGQNEEREGRPFCGTSGDELDRYLSSARISRDECYVSNIVNARPPDNSDPTREMIVAHEGRLADELLTVRPRYVLTLGRFALRWFLGDGAKLEREWGLAHTVLMCADHGLPVWRSCCVDGGRWSIVLVAAHHPAYGLYMPDDQVLIEEALVGRIGPTWGLRKVMDGQLPPHPPVDQYPRPVYAEIVDAEDVERLLGSASAIGLDTEGSVARPWCVSVSAAPGTGYVIDANNGPAIRAFALWLRRRNPIVVMHFAAHDIEVLESIGIRVAEGRLADTMLIAHLLGPMFSQALKLGAYRELGMAMSDYEDLTRDADRALAVEYLERVLSEGRCAECRGRGLVVRIEPAHTVPAHTREVMTKAGPRARNMKAKLVAAKRVPETCDACAGDGVSWPVPRALPIWDNGQLKLWQPSPVGKRTRRILDDVRAGKVNAEGEPTDPRARWQNADPPEAIEAVERALGPMPHATLDMVDRQTVIEYAARDADATLRRWLLLDPLVDEWGLRETYNTDLAIIPLLVSMQQTGVEVDREYFSELSREWKAELARIRHRLQKAVGYYVNPGSSKQVANLLFGKLRLASVKQTKSKEGESTDDKVLEQLAMTVGAPVAKRAIELIQRYRELHKLDSTYAEPLSLVDSVDRRVRMEFRYTRTPTGRLSSAKPRSGQNKRNFIQGQNIPTRGEEGKRIRKGIVARAGYLLGSWDLSQVEWRVMAHLSQDPNLLKVFREGHDLHRMTAALIWKLAIELVTAAQRSSAKNIGFGMGYKISWRGLQQQFAVRGIALSREEAQAFIDGFMTAYPGIPAMWEEIFASGRRNGYVRTQDGRIRWATALRCRASWVRESCEREVGNTPTQGLAAWIMKRIMIEIDRRVVKPMRRVGIDVRVWLVVHDSIELEFPEGAEALIDPLIRRVMRETVKLSVPLSGDGHWATNWAACKPD